MIESITKAYGFFRIVDLCVVDDDMNGLYSTNDEEEDYSKLLELDLTCSRLLNKLRDSRRLSLSLSESGFQLFPTEPNNDGSQGSQGSQPLDKDNDEEYDSEASKGEHFEQREQNEQVDSMVEEDIQTQESDSLSSYSEQTYSDMESSYEEYSCF